MKLDNIPSTVASTPYNSHRYKIFLNVTVLVALIFGSISFRGPGISYSLLYTFFIVISGSAFFLILLTTDPLIFTINKNTAIYAWITMGSLILAIFLNILYSILFTPSLLIMTIILTGILCVLNVVFDLKLRAILKNENDYLLKYVSKIIKDYDKRPDIKQKDGEKAGDLNTYAMVGYLVLFITTRGVLSYVRIYAIQMVLLLFVALISVFFLQALIYKKLYGEIKKHIKKIVLFGQMTTIAMASGITATILAPTDNSMLQWLMTVVVSLSYAPFYFFVMRASKYLNAIRLQVILEVLNNS